MISALNHARAHRWGGFADDRTSTRPGAAPTTVQGIVIRAYLEQLLLRHGGLSGDEVAEMKLVDLKKTLAAYHPELFSASHALRSKMTVVEMFEREAPAKSRQKLSTM